MGNCLPSHRKKRDKVVLPMRVYPANAQRVVPRFFPGQEFMNELKFGSESSLRSSKPAALDKKTIIVHERQTSSKLSFASLSTISAADSFDSLLVKLHQSHSDFDLTTPSGNFTKTSPELVRPPAPSPRKMNCYDSVNESKLLQKDVNQTLPPQPDVAVNEKPRDHTVNEETYETRPRGERPGPADWRIRRPKFTDPLLTCAVDDDEYQTLFPDEDVKVEGTKDPLVSKLQDTIDYIMTDDPLPKEKPSKPEGSSPVRLDLSDDEEPQETPAQSELPESRKPKCTDQLIICDIDDDEFQDIITAEVQKVADSKEDPLVVSEIEDAIEYILNDGPPQKEKSACNDHFVDEPAQLTPPRGERPKQANHKVRRPKFTDPLITGDVNEDEFQAVFTDEDQKVDGVDKADSLNKMIDDILEEDSLPKEKHSRRTGHTQAEVQEDKGFVSVADGAEGACAATPKVFRIVFCGLSTLL